MSVQQHYTAQAGEGSVQGLEYYDSEYPDILQDQSPLVHLFNYKMWRKKQKFIKLPWNWYLFNVS